MAISSFTPHPAVELVLLLAFLLILPILLVKSMKYNAMMTTLNNVRFNFHYKSGRAWWVMMGLPIALYALLTVVILVVLNIPGGDHHSIMAMITKAFIAFVIFLVGAAAIAGVLFAKWFALVGEGGRFGSQHFSVSPSVKHCIKICLLSILIFVVFLFVIAWLLSGIFIAIITSGMMGGMSESTQTALLLNYKGQIIACYLLYFAAIVLSQGYMWMGLRNHFINNLSLADGAVRFHSGIAFHALVLQWVLIAVVSSVTLGLAYPLMKMRYLRFLAANTWVDGDLDALALSDHDEQPETGPIALLSRGIMPQVPFV